MNFEQIRDNFSEELRKAAQGEKTSLAYITTQLPKHPFMTQGKFQAIVIGGTHYHIETAQLQKDGSLAQRSNLHKGQIPQFATQEIFLNFIEKIIDPSVAYICLNFAYQILPVFRDNTLDSRFIHSDKEHAFEGMIDKLVGQTIEHAIEKNTGRKIQVIVANDATCLVLAGLQQHISRETLAGCIVGSGFNMAFFADKNILITLESGSFDKLEQTATGKQIDEASMNPGRGLFEKEVSGLYLYQHYNILHEQHHLSGQPLNNSKELSELATIGKTQESYLARDLLKRSASLTAAQMAGLYLFKDKPKTLTFIVEGSVIQHAWHYQQMIQEELGELGVPSGAIKLIHIENSSLVGAAELLTVKRD